MSAHVCELVQCHASINEFGCTCVLLVYYVHHMGCTSAGAGRLLHASLIEAERLGLQFKAKVRVKDLGLRHASSLCFAPYMLQLVSCFVELAAEYPRNVA